MWFITSGIISEETFSAPVQIPDSGGSFLCDRKHQPLLPVYLSYVSSLQSFWHTVWQIQMFHSSPGGFYSDVQTMKQHSDFLCCGAEEGLASSEAPSLPCLPSKDYMVHADLWAFWVFLENIRCFLTFVTEFMPSSSSNPHTFIQTLNSCGAATLDYPT